MADEHGNAESIAEVFVQVEGVHRALHVLETTVDSPTVTVALYERDALLICAALPVLECFYPCVHDLSAHLQARLIELARAQEPGFQIFAG